MNLNASSAMRRRVALIRQSEYSECGLACLAMIANYHGLTIDLNSLRRRFPPSCRGVRLKDMIEAAYSLGLTARALKVPMTSLAKVQAPAILHWDLNHYVVLERTRGNKALIHNPALQSRWHSFDEISEHFTGVVLELRPGFDFKPQDLSNRLSLRQLWGRVRGVAQTASQVLLLSIAIEAALLAYPFYTQIAVDSVLPTADLDMLTVLAVGFVALMLVNAGATILRSYSLVAAGTSLGFSLSSGLGRRLFRLPVEWFSRRNVGDVLSRFQSVVPIQSLLTERALATVIDGVFTIFTLALMLAYSPMLSLFALTGFALYAIAKWGIFPVHRAAEESAIVATGREQSVLIETLRGITTVRLYNHEGHRHSLWESRLTDVANAKVKLGRIAAWQATLTTTIVAIENVVSVWLAIRLIMASEFTLGMFFAFTAYKMQFLTKANSLVDQLLAFRMIRLHLDRLADIALTSEDRSFVGPALAPRMLEGRIELRDIWYRYSPQDPWVLEGVNLLVEPGDYIAITGPSGGGKTTLAKILLGLLEPNSGEVLIDNVPLTNFGLQNYHRLIGAVLQEDSLFAGSLADNIGLFDEVQDMTQIVAASKLAAIHEDILAMPMQYDTLVGDMGSSLSGGQRQRILIARALYRRPKLVVLDEGTSHLDVGQEMKINSAISKMDVTRIIIAHRPETIASAAKVFIQTEGKLTESQDNAQLRS